MVLSDVNIRGSSVKAERAEPALPSTPGCK